LQLDSGENVTGNTAILPYLGKRFGLWPSDPLAETRALSLIGLFAASVHPAHAHISRPERYASDRALFANLQEVGRKSFQGYLEQIDRLLNGRQWLCEQYSVLDPYALTFYAWGVRRELPVADLQYYRAFKDRMLARPAVARVLADEKVKV
jgi:glutathione S-transferase